MEMIYLALTCTFFSVQFIFSKLYQKNSSGSINASLWMTIFYAIYSIVFFGVQIGFTPEISTSAVIYALLYSVAGIFTTLSSIIGMSLGRVSTITTFMLLGGMVLPFIYGVTVLNEAITIPKVIAIVIMIVSLIPSLISKEEGENKEQDKKKHMLYILVLLIVFIGNGAISIITNASQKAPDAVSTENYMFIIAVIQIIIALTTAIIIALKNKKSEENFTKSLFSGVGKAYTLKAILLAFLCSALYGVCNSLGNVFSLACVNANMDASIQFPVISGSVIVLTALIAWALFKETPKKKDWISIVLSVAGVILFIF
ncbi:MAG: EamA family transporter [Clostridia bacterium]|nr:EamA family transporter [Clostridia bacterium]